MKRIIFHGGHLKTGTTAAQWALAVHRADLSAHGVLYPAFGAPVPHQQGMMLTSWTPLGFIDRKLIWNKCAEDWKAAPEQTILLSAEGASNLTREDWVSFRESFEGFHLTFVFTLRHWAGFSPSRWQQHIRRGDSLSFPTMLARVDADFESSIDGDISLPLQRAYGIFDRIVAVPYVSSEAAPRLYAALELPDNLRDLISSSVRRDNESLDFLKRECIRLYNAIYNDHYGRDEAKQYSRSVNSSVPHDDEGRMRRVLLKSEAPAAQALRRMIEEARQDAPRSTWAALFEGWTEKLNVSLARIGLPAMPDTWGRDEIGKQYSFTEIGVGDLPRNVLKGCRSAILRQPERAASEDEA